MPTITMKKEVQVEAETLKIYCKVSDNFTASLVDKHGAEIYDQEEGYVPGFMPGQHYGDYVILDIDLGTGRILNWKPPTAEDIQAWIDPD